MKTVLSILLQAKATMCTVWGWILLAFTAFWDFIEPDAASLFIIVVAIVFDFLCAMLRCYKTKTHLQSLKGQGTFKKLLVYLPLLMVCFAIERTIHDSSFMVSKLLCAIAASCELWSASASLLIFYPEMPFLKLFRLQLRKEIEKKTGIKTDDIFKENEGDVEIIVTKK